MKLSLPLITELADAGGYSGIAALSNDSAALALSVCAYLHQTWNWSGAGLELTTDEIDEIDALVSKLEYELMLSSVGLVMTWAGASVPAWALLCDGAVVAVDDYPELGAVMMAEWAASADTFYLPNLTNRVPVGAGDEYAMGDLVGAKEKTLTYVELPPHRHTYNFPVITAIAVGGAAPLTVSGITWSNRWSGYMGDGDPFSLMQPSQALMYIIVSGRTT